MKLFGWFFSSFMLPTLRFGDDGGGGGSGDNAAAEEARKDELRARIDKMYGIGSDPDATAAKTSMEAERGQLSDATRGYYTDQLNRSFGAAERNNRFRLARQGLQGGSVDVDTNTELGTDKNLGAVRIDQAARKSAADLDAQREQERLNAVSLVNSGAGDSAVSSAQAGLRNSLNQQSNTQRANLFGDLFSAGSDAYAGQQLMDANALLSQRYAQQLGAYFPASKTSSGRVTSTGG